MKLFHGMTRQQRIGFLEETASGVRREMSVAALQWFAVSSSNDALNYPAAENRRRALLLTLDFVNEELDLLYEEEEQQASRLELATRKTP
jgi:hypothetical protein